MRKPAFDKLNPDDLLVHQVLTTLDPGQVTEQGMFSAIHHQIVLKQTDLSSRITLLLLMHPQQWYHNPYLEY